MKLKKRKKSEYSSLTLLNERISPAYEEAIKRLRIRVMHEAETEGSGVIMVTSSIPRRGKDYDCCKPGDCHWQGRESL